MKTRILAHRGWWLTPDEKNSRVALERAIRAGYGVETDIRDLDGELVISHDPPKSAQVETTFRQFLDMYVEIGTNGWLALNVKSDGIAADIEKMLKDRSIMTAFVFDMSVPDMRGYFGGAVEVFTRRSDVETAPAYLEKSGGIWLDSFDIEHVPAPWVGDCLSMGKVAALVSPELHKRPHLPAWAEWKGSFDLAGNDRIMLCTDFPDEARSYFGRRA